MKFGIEINTDAIGRDASVYIDNLITNEIRRVFLTKAGQFPNAQVHMVPPSLNQGFYKPQFTPGEYGFSNPFQLPEMFNLGTPDWSMYSRHGQGVPQALSDYIAERVEKFIGDRLESTSGPQQEKPPVAKPEPEEQLAEETVTEDQAGNASQVLADYVDELDFSKRVLRNFRQNDPVIIKVSDLVSYTPDEIIKRPGFGVVALGEIIEVLASQGLKLREIA